MPMRWRALYSLSAPFIRRMRWQGRMRRWRATACRLFCAAAISGGCTVSLRLFAIIIPYRGPALSLFQFLLQALVDGVQELFGVKEVFSMFDLIAVYADGQVFGHLAAFDGLDTYRFERIGEMDQVLVAVQFAPEGETAGPGEDGGDGIGGSRLAGLVVTIVA